MLIDYSSVNICQEAQEVLSDVSFSVGSGEFVYVIGKVGSGKSSLFKTIYGELPLREGRANVLGFDLTRLRQAHLPRLRRKLGIIFQDFQLLTDRTVEANLRFVLHATGWKNKIEIKERIADVLSLVGMGTKGYKFPSELSGGEQQRIAIARAILNDPELILADEPTGNLDAETSRNITELLHKICEKGTTVMMITHNLHLPDMFPGRVFQCKDHRLAELTHGGDTDDAENGLNGEEEEEQAETDAPEDADGAEGDQ